MTNEELEKTQEKFIYDILKGCPFKGEKPLDKVKILDKVSKRLREDEKIEIPFGIDLDLENEEAYCLMEILQTFNSRLTKRQQYLADYLADTIYNKLFKEGN